VRVVIIEDEKPAANHLKWLLQQIDENIEVVDEIQTVREAIQRLPDTRADLFFFGHSPGRRSVL
jgi:DNA-binding LytR/AlgR family response regulator